MCVSLPLLSSLVVLGEGNKKRSKTTPITKNQKETKKIKKKKETKETKERKERKDESNIIRGKCGERRETRACFSKSSE